MSCSMILNSYFCNHDYAEINNQTSMLRPKSQNLKLAKYGNDKFLGRCYLNWNKKLKVFKLGKWELTSKKEND